MLTTCPILYLEDDGVDQESLKRAFIRLNITNPLLIMENGQEALEYLQNPEKEKPCLILLDLNMPQVSGVEFLEIIKLQDNLKRIPVVILTTSKQESDVVESYNLGVSGYIVKPVDYKQFIEVVRTIHVYWTLSLTPPPILQVEKFWNN